MTSRLARALAAPYLRWVRPVLEDAGPVRYAGVVTPHVRKRAERRLPDAWLPDEAKDVPGYEEALVRELRAQVLEGDRVVVSGGGLGVTATAAAVAAGSGGRVDVFEAVARQAVVVRETARLNGVADRVRVWHASLGRPSGGGPVLEGGALPPCDVLELDCEGAELVVLERVVQRPRVVLVETHGVYGAPTAAVAARLQAMGYDVHDAGPAEPRLGRLHHDLDVHVLRAARR